jgi:hypothetical protein
MRTLLKTILLIITAVYFYSCEEDFNLKTDYKPRYALNCIIRADTTLHMATITKSYMVDGFDPNVYSEDPFISGADIRMWEKDNVFFFTDTLIPRKDTSRFHSMQKVYIINNYRPAENEFLEIKAILDNGKILSANTVIPKKVKWDTSSTVILPGDITDEFSVRWTKNNNIGWFLVRLQIRYRNDGINSPLLSAPVPVRFDGESPVYPAATKNLGVSFKFSAFEKAMRDLSAGQPDKSKIIIQGILVELLILDDNLSKYFSNQNGFMDDFTIRVDQNDYSNIEGGFGIFGSYLKQIGGIQIQKEYSRSLGYGVPN